MTDRSSRQAEISAERTRAFLLPSAAATLLFLVLVYLQFDFYRIFPGPGPLADTLTKVGFIAQLPLGIGFYFCYAWHRSLVQRANVHQEKLNKG